MNNAIWITDYDFHTDKCFKRPGCPKCEEPIWKYEDGKYHCFNCGEKVDVINDDMKEWFVPREESKIEYEDCPKIQVKGHSIGCGGKKCVKVTYHRNPVTLKWQAAYGHCENCDYKFIV